MGLAWLVGLAAAGHAAEPGSGAPALGAWQHHKLSFDYRGTTTAYTCSGLEDRIKNLLRYLGARDALEVHAAGCPGAPDTPARMIRLYVEFDALAPGGDVTAEWRPLRLSPHSPSMMGEGDCELVQELKPLLTSAFALREVEYRTRCFPHSVDLNSYSIQAEVLKPAAAGQP